MSRQSFFSMKTQFPEQTQIFQSLGLREDDDFRWRVLDGIIMVRHVAEVVKKELPVTTATFRKVMALPGVISATRVVGWKDERHATHCKGCKKLYGDADPALSHADGKIDCLRHRGQAEPVVVTCHVNLGARKVSATHMKDPGSGRDIPIASLIGVRDLEAFPASNDRYEPLVKDGVMIQTHLPAQLLVTMPWRGRLKGYVLPADLVEAKARGYFVDLPLGEVAETELPFYPMPVTFMRDGNEVTTLGLMAIDDTGKEVVLGGTIPDETMGTLTVHVRERLDRYEATLANLAVTPVSDENGDLQPIDPNKVAYKGVLYDLYDELDRLKEIRNSRNAPGTTLESLRGQILPKHDPAKQMSKLVSKAFLEDRFAILAACFDKAILNALKREQEAKALKEAEAAKAAEAAERAAKDEKDAADAAAKGDPAAMRDDAVGGPPELGKTGTGES